MSENKVQEHPSTILRREIDDLKKRIDQIEKSVVVTEQVMVELIQKHNKMKDTILALLGSQSQNDPKKPSRPNE